MVLTSYDASGNITQTWLPNYVIASGPVANFGLIQSTNCQSAQISFVDSSFNASHWNWSFGDNTTDTVQNPVHIYNGSFSNQIVTLTVSDSVGCSNSVSRLIVSNFIGSIIASQPEVCVGDSVSFNTSFQFYNSYMWNFGDGNNSSITAPSHVYTTPGSYFVTLTVTDVFGCSQSFTSNVPVDVLQPIANFSINGPQNGCNTLDVNFTNNSTGANHYLWNFGDGNTSNAINPVHTYSN
ncbi:MAG: PKD domain-containing protein, partial [Bacteroidia bacterium]|nr:PKD domain-containing protein [Bacteroidia bacterium]